MTDADITELSGRIAAAITGWTWPEVLRAVMGAMGAEPASTELSSVAMGGVAMAEAVTTRVLRIPEPEPAPEPTQQKRVAAIRAALQETLQPWLIPPPPALRRVVEPRPPEPPDAPLPHDLPELHDVADLAAWLDFTPGELDWFADHGCWLRTARPTLRHYRVFRVAQRHRTRVIEAPKPRLRETQRRLLSRLVGRVPAHPAARGFVPGSSPAAFAWPHTDRAVVLRVDLRHCFTSIGVGRVRQVFTDVGYPQPIARVLADLCTTATPAADLRGLDWTQAALLRARHLPQGAPTSPHLANLVLRGLDRRVDGYARKHGLHYTRYGDDLALSGDTMHAGRTLWTVLRIVDDAGFTVHPDKVRVMRAHQRQRLAGLVVNDRPQVARAEYDRVKALLHNAIRFGAERQNRAGHADFRAHVYGLIAWIGATNDTRRARLLDLAARVDWAS
ncbi:hypothetical protein GCM10009624_09760 [Gordonia sinesedis]